MKNTFVT
jgi:hypothetical protein